MSVMGISPVGFAVVAVAIFAASCLQASIGFGIGMLAAPIVAIVDPALIPGTLIMVATFGSVSRASGRRARRHRR